MQKKISKLTTEEKHKLCNSQPSCAQCKKEVCCVWDERSQDQIVEIEEFEE